MPGPFRIVADEASEESGELLFMPDATAADWAKVFSHAERLCITAGLAVLQAGERDRALYLLVDGWLRAPSGVVHPITTLGEGAFLDGAPRAVSVEAMSDGEVMRLSYEAFESLAARNPALARHILLDLGRILSARLRAGAAHTPGWTG